MFTYDYLGQDTIVDNGFTWKDNDWRYFGKQLTFKGPGIYSEQPDSIISYYSHPDSLSSHPTSRRYLQYQDLGNDKIYFKDEKYRYFPASDEWKLTQLKEEWYHVKGSMVDSLSNHENSFFVFPNPAVTGQELKFNFDPENNNGLEVLIFNMQGQLVSKENLDTGSTIKAPWHKGIYTVLIRDGELLFGAVKLVVME